MRKRIETCLPFIMIAAVIAVIIIGVVHYSQSARSEEETITPPPDAGPYGVPMNKLDLNDPWGFNKNQPLVQLKDLPPLPPPFGTGQRVKADGTIQTTDSALPPDVQQKMQQLKARRSPWSSATKEGK